MWSCTKLLGGGGGQKVALKILNLTLSFFSNLATLDYILAELGTFEWWISGLRLNPLFFLISRLT